MKSRSKDGKQMGGSLLGREGFYGWVTIAGAALVFFVGSGAMMYPFGLFLPHICDDFGWSRGLVSGALALCLAMAGISTALAGWFVTRYGARRTIVTGSILCGIGLLILSSHTKVWQLYMGYGLLIGTGIGIGGLIPTTALANNWFVRKRSLALGIIVASAGLGPVVLLPFIASIIQAFGWRSTYQILFGLVIVFMVMVPGIFVRNKPEDLGQVPDGSSSSKKGKPPHKENTQPVYNAPVDYSAGEAVRTMSLWLLTVFMLSQFFAMSVLAAHLASFISDMGVASGLAATIFGLLPGMSIVGKLGAGFLGLRISSRSLAFGASLLTVLGIVMIVTAKGLAIITTGIMLFGMGCGAAMLSFLNLLAMYFGRKDYPKIMGFTMPFVQILAGAGAPIAGYLYDAKGSYIVPFSLLILVLLVGLGCFSLASPPVHPSLKKELAEI